MNEQERVWKIAEFKQEMVETKTGNDIKAGLEIRDENAVKLQNTASIDPGWQDFTERTQAAAETEGEAWQTVAEQGEELGLRQALQAYEYAEDDADVIRAALYAAGTRGTATFSEESRVSYAPGASNAAPHVPPA